MHHCCDKGFCSCADPNLNLCNRTDGRTHSVGLHVGCFHLGQVVSRGELEVVLQVNLEQGVVVTDIVLRT